MRDGLLQRSFRLRRVALLVALRQMYAVRGESAMTGVTQHCDRGYKPGRLYRSEPQVKS